MRQYSLSRGVISVESQSLVRPKRLLKHSRYAAVLQPSSDSSSIAAAPVLDEEPDEELDLDTVGAIDVDRVR